MLMSLRLVEYTENDYHLKYFLFYKVNVFFEHEELVATFLYVFLDCSPQFARDSLHFPCFFDMIPN